jgi:PAS domain S-box-containing protein
MSASAHLSELAAVASLAAAAPGLLAAAMLGAASPGIPWVWLAVGLLLAALLSAGIWFARVRQRAVASLRKRHRMFQRLFESAPDAILLVDPAGRIVRLNTQTESLFGYSRNELAGQAVDQLLPDRFRARHGRHLAGYFAAPRARPMGAGLELFGRRKDGREFPVDIMLSPLDTEEGMQALATIRDVSERKRAEEERDRFFVMARDLLCVAGFDGYFKRLNPAWKQMLGYTDGELRAAPFLEFVHPDDRERTAAESSGLAAGRESVSFVNRYRCKDGSYRRLLWNARSVVADRLIFASARDMTDQGRAEEEIRQLNADLQRRAAQLEAANRELEAFSYSVSHDLRAPLRHIDGFAGMLEKELAPATDEKVRRHLQIISGAARQMGRLIDDLLAFSRVGRVPLSLVRVDHDALVAAAIREGGYEGSGPAIAWSCGPLPTVHADRAMLRQVWTNLIDNAVKYSAHSAQPRIEIGSRADPATGEIVFFVRDNGAGFDMRYAGKLFQVFQRLHSANEFEGTGIGLASVRRIVERHGGRVWAEGRPQAGATFSFSLPPPPADGGGDSRNNP